MSVTLRSSVQVDTRERWVGDWISSHVNLNKFNQNTHQEQSHGVDISFLESDDTFTTFYRGVVWYDQERGQLQITQDSWHCFSKIFENFSNCFLFGRERVICSALQQKRASIRSNESPFSSVLQALYHLPVPHCTALTHHSWRLTSSAIERIDPSATSFYTRFVHGTTETQTKSQAAKRGK
jgi:hypothetical protein